MTDDRHCCPFCGEGWPEVPEHAWNALEALQAIRDQELTAAEMRKLAADALEGNDE